ncbi:MAG: amidohydrolase, partial [Alphaproteobacteria bacterium]|nr:amidohydrolase [Alphaproteobacteria bacterium]
MQYKVISADCHVDLIWLPPDLFTSQASAKFKERMPFLTDGPKGKQWVSKSG